MASSKSTAKSNANKVEAPAGTRPGTGDVSMPTGDMNAGATMSGVNPMASGTAGAGMDVPSDGGMMGGSGDGMMGGLSGGMMDGHEAESRSFEMGPAGPGAAGEPGRVSVLVEMRVPAERGLEAAIGMDVPGLQIDPTYQPVPLKGTAGAGLELAGEPEQTVIVRGMVSPDQIAAIEAQPNVVKVWKDTPIAPFGAVVEQEQKVREAEQVAAAPCAILPCDCDPSTPKGTIADVANYLGASAIWGAGFRGDGIVVGVVDGGTTAQGRTINPGDTGNPNWPNKLIPRVIGGWPTADWGTTGASWGWHANMCATDVLGMAPNAQIYDIRIASGSLAGTISNALAGFQWAIDQHRANGTPQVLTNSWGIFQENWDADYAHNPNHPFTRKVLEALDEGILVLFAAGNCGGACPDGRCGGDNGPGHSIWGANSHPRVITVGAVNRQEEWVGYSSQGPGALDPNKPDFCSVTHFTGFFNSDSGTSAATPICAGIVALLKQADPAVTQDEVKNALKTTAKDIGPAGFDQHSGAGIIRPKLAFDVLAHARASSGPVTSWGPNRLDIFVVGTNSAAYHKWWNGAAWGPSPAGYEFMGGALTSRPEVVSWAPNRLDMFVLGTNKALFHKWWNGAAWGPSVTGWENMGGVITSRPKAVAWGPNRLDVFAFGLDHALYHKWWNGAAWGPSVTGYENLGGTCLGDPEAVAWGPNRLDVFVLGTNRAIFHKWWNGAAWGPSVTGWENMGGTCMSSPTVVSWGPNRLDLFVIGTDRALYHKWWNGSAWGPSVTGWEYMGGICVSKPTVVSWGPNRLDVFVIGTDSALYHKWWNGAAWGPSVTGWEKLGGVCTSAPEATAWGPNRLDIFVTGTDSALYHKYWNGAAWGPSVMGWEGLGGVITEL